MFFHITYNKLPFKGDNNQFSKFVILTYPRTGSNFLIFLLQLTNCVVCYNELFHNRNRIISHYSQTQFNIIDVLYRNIFTNYFLNEIFWKYEKKIKAVGFKLTYYQDEMFKKNNLINLLADKYGVLFIHLKRKNLLACYLSYFYMKKEGIVHVINPHFENVFKKVTNKYILPNERSTYLKSFVININDLDAYINEIKQKEHKYDLLISNNKSITIYYEDLKNNSLNEISKILQLLYIKNATLNYEKNFPTEKLNIYSFKQLILNYEEIKNYLVKNNLGEYLEES